ncbi:diacylglycerol kinase family protein [Bulleidia sp. zg-1006]|uniref:diacylglycerol/lipid kinase family protein n=1 Tax=Bulleidia sp. zg-1006 TaxID=2806552 RepID=UPI001939CC93|nr:diacylglycerol kinase family protein [Bulleidia sp. zg-1006]QRG86221.1 hypothetical protein JOS54_04985 [Bulleidia sp. zg-1006]
MYYVIVNPGSGSYRNKTWLYVENEFQKRGILYQVFFSTKNHDVNDILKGLQHGQVMDVIIIGGDGSMNLAVNAIRDFTKVRLGYIPSGSGNDFGRGMNITRDAQVALEAILKEGYRQVDVPEIQILQGDYPQRRRFLISCGIGYDALACYHVSKSHWKAPLNKIGMGHLVYLAYGALSMFEYKPFSLSDEKEEIAFIAVMNQRYEGGGFLFSPNASAEDGLLDFVKISKIKRFRMVSLIPSARDGKHVNTPYVHIEQKDQEHFKFNQPVYIHVDGETLGKAIEVKFLFSSGKLILLNN